MATKIEKLIKGADTILPRTTSNAVTMSDGSQLEGQGLLMFSNTISNNVTIPTGKNALSVGTVIIEEGVTVTVSDDSTWVIV